jgi:hypothetical protein
MLNINPQFLIDADGQRSHVLLSIAEFHSLLERIEEIEDAKLLHSIAAQTSKDDFVDWDVFTAGLRAKGKLD